MAVVADVQADVIDGIVPLIVNFDASGSTSDDNITKYEFDLDGNGTYELDSLLDPTPAAKTYNTPGIYTVKVRVTDDEDNVDTDEIVITAKSQGEVSLLDVQALTDISGETHSLLRIANKLIVRTEKLLLREPSSTS